jgi:hypothetical protein
MKSWAVMDRRPNMKCLGGVSELGAVAALVDADDEIW